MPIARLILPLPTVISRKVRFRLIRSTFTLVLYSYSQTVVTVCTMDILFTSSAMSSGTRNGIYACMLITHS